MTSTTAEIKCARCNRALVGPPNPKGHDRLSCPSCGEGDTLDRVMGEVGEYVKEQMASALHDTLTKGVRRSDFLKVTSKRPPKRFHRFICDVNL